MSTSIVKYIDPREAEVNACRGTAWTTWDLYKKHDQINYKTVYQRNFVWTPGQCVDFLHSIYIGHRVPAMTLSIRDRGYNCMDGLQRGHVFYFFYSDQLKIPLFIPEVNKVEYLTYSEIEQLAEEGKNDTCYRFLERMKDSTIDVNIYNKLTLEDQVSLFRKINHSAPLSTGEKVLCPNYYVRLLCEFIWEEIFSDIKPLIKDVNNLRMKQSHMVAQMLYTVAGNDFTMGYCAKDVGKKKLIEACENMQRILLEKLPRNLSSINLQKIKDSCHPGLKNTISVISSAQLWAAEMLKSRHIKGLSKTNFMDLMYVYIDWINQGVMTSAFNHQNAEVLAGAFSKHVEWKLTEANSNTEQPVVVQYRHENLKQFFKDTGLDFGRKKQKAKALDKAKAWQKFDGTDPNTNRRIGPDDKIEHDHLKDYGAATTSSSEVQITARAANRHKERNRSKK